MTTKVMISFPEEFLVQVDATAAAEQRSRSELVREALRRYMAERDKAVRLGDLPEVRAAVESLTALSQLAPGEGEDSSADVRMWRDRRR